MNETNETYKVGYFVVAFIDILGQRDVLRSIKELPRSTNRDDQTIKLLRDSAGKVMQWREIFEGFLNAYTDPSSYGLTQLYRKGADDQIKYFIDRALLHRITLRYFSDSVLLSAPLSSTDGEIPMGDVFGILAGVGGLMSLLPTTDSVARAGVDIGIGMVIDSETKEVYGPVLENTYYLESRIAQYPRVVLGDSLIEYINLNWNDGSLQGQLTSKLAEKCKSLIIREDDIAILDYYGSGFRNLDLGIPMPDTIETSFNFASEQLEKYQVEQNEKLIEKYTKFRDYIKSRFSVWHIRSS